MSEIGSGQLLIGDGEVIECFTQTLDELGLFCLQAAGQVSLVCTQQINNMAVIALSGAYVAKKCTLLIRASLSLERRANHKGVERGQKRRRHLRSGRRLR